MFMRKIMNFMPVGLVSLGLTLALGGAAFADPGGRHNVRDRESEGLQLNRNYHLHKRHYGNGHGHDRKGFSGRKAPNHYRGPDTTPGRDRPARPARGQSRRI
jgi:hypothetical protein